MSKIKVSVVIPVFNVENYIEKCLNSVVNQTLKDIEIICVDDCSTDNSVSIVENYVKKDSRVKLIKQPFNQGQGAARNVGIKQATGEYITFLDSDDWINLECYKKAYAKSKINDIDCLLFKISTVDEITGEIISDDPYFSLKPLKNLNKTVFNHQDTKEVTCNICVHVGSKFYNREFILKNNLFFPEGIFFEDEPFFYKVYLNANRISILDENLYYYRINRENSTISGKGKYFVDVIEAFRLVRKIFIETNNLDNEYKKLLYNKFFYSIFTRFDETSEEFKPNFFTELKNDFHSFLKTRNDLNLLYHSYQLKAINVLFSSDYNEFKNYETGVVKQKFTIQDIKKYYKISIILPVYNVEKYIVRALDSIINQTFGFSNLEVLVIDDMSTDKTRDIIKEYSDNYDNIIPIFLDKNSGFAGKPRNIGLKYASADYVMFLDPDDYYIENACEVLYNKIINNNVDLVSGNYIDIKFNENKKYDWAEKFNVEGDEIYVNSIKENINLFKIYPSVWAKIFRKEFILNNNIIFPEGVPGQDLYFVYVALLKANGIIFVDKEIIMYEARDGDDSSVTCKNNKRVIKGLIKVYTDLYLIINEFLHEASWIVLKQLFFWINKFIDSNLDILDIKEIVGDASFIFSKFFDSGLVPHEHQRKLFEDISKNKYENVIIDLDELIHQDPSKRLEQIIRNKEILLLCYNLELKISGVTRSVLNKSKSFVEAGFNVTILTIDFGTNYEFIEKELKRLGHLHESINIINLYDYFKNKSNLKQQTYTVPNDNDYDAFDIEIVMNDDNTKDLNYFDGTQKVKTERYANDKIIFEWLFDNEKCIKQRAFNNDGFCYFQKEIKFGREFYEVFYSNQFKLYFGGAHEYNTALKIQDYFIEQVCGECSEKPFLILECVGHIPSIGNINPQIAYKYGQLHLNIYQEPYTRGSELKSYSAVTYRDGLEYLITLTNAQKEDLMYDLQFDRIKVIPNIVQLPKSFTEKKIEDIDCNKFSILSRLTPQKNISDAIKAFNIVTKENSAARLEIFGDALNSEDSAEEKKLKSLVKDLSLEKNVIFKGYVDNVHKEIFNSISTIFVSHYEGFSMTFLESMINGTTCISYNFNYGPSDFIINGENGILVEMYDVETLSQCILDVLNNPMKALELGKNAQKHLLNNFSEEIIVSKWESIFQDALLNYVPKDNNIKLSIIIPIFNTGKYLKECLDSIVNQSLKEIEIICIDDGSTDDSLEILFEYAAHDDRIIIISKENEGQGPSRNLGLKFARGDYFTFVDSDDWINIETYEKVYNHARENDLDLVMFKLINFDDDTHEIYETAYYNMAFLDKYSYKTFNHYDVSNIFAIPVSPCNKIYRTKLIKDIKAEFPAGFTMFEDNPFFFDAFLHSNKVSIIPEHFYYRRVRQNSTMTNRSNLADIIGIYNKIIEIFQKNNLLGTYNTALLNNKISVTKMWFDKSEEDYKSFFFKSIKNDFETIFKYNNIHYFNESQLTDLNQEFYKNINNNSTFREFYLNNELSVMKTELEKLKNNNNTLKKDYDELNHNNTNLKKDYDELNFSYSQLKNEYGNLFMNNIKLENRQIYLQNLIEYIKNNEKNKKLNIFSKYIFKK